VAGPLKYASTYQPESGIPKYYRPFSKNIRAYDRSFIFPDLGVNLTLARYRLRRKNMYLPIYISYLSTYIADRRVQRPACISEGNADKRLKATKFSYTSSYLGGNKQQNICSAIESVSLTYAILIDPKIGIQFFKAY